MCRWRTAVGRGWTAGDGYDRRGHGGGRLRSGRRGVRGQSDQLDAPVCRYWPEFAAAGKEGILVRHVVSHQAGLPGLTTPVTCEEAGDDVRMARLLAAQPALHPPGAGFYWSNPPRFTSDPLPVNTRVWWAAEIPGSSGVASAASLARLYGCLACGGELDGVRLLTSATLDLGRTRLSYGVEPYLQEPMAFGIGYGLQTEARPFGPAGDGFGHNGAGGSVHGAWPELRTGFSYISTTLQDLQGPDPRPAALLEALHDALHA